MKKIKSAFFCSLLAASSVVAAAQNFNEVEASIIQAMISDDITSFVNGQNNLIGRILKKEGTPVSLVDPFDFSIDYNENEIRANQKYKGKSLYFRNCQVAGIAAGITDAPIVSCVSPAAYLPAQLHFSNSKESIEFTAQLRKGSRIDAVCVGAGEVAGLPMADDCRPNTEFFREASKKFFETFNDRNSSAGALCSALVIRTEMVMTDEERKQCLSGCSKAIQTARGKFGEMTDWLDDVKPRLLELGFRRGLEELEALLHEKE